MLVKCMDEIVINWLKPDSASLHTAVFGKSGSGKTFLIKNSLYAAIKDEKNFPSYHRFIVIDPKRQGGDFDILAKPIESDDWEEIAESINENRVTVIWPEYSNTQEIIDVVIDILFQYSEIFPAFSATLIIDEAGEVISHQKIPPSIGKLAVQGRSKLLKLVVLNQRPILNRKLDAQLENILLFSQVSIDADNLQKRWGLSLEEIMLKLDAVQYSFYCFNTMKNTRQFYGPLVIN